MDPAYLLPLIAPILAGQADYTKGNRFLHARQLDSMPLLRRAGNLGLSFFTKLASGYWNMFDPTNGYTAIHAAVVPVLDEASIDRRYFFETSMFLELSLLRAVVKDVYIPARYGNEMSHLSEWKVLLDFPPRLLYGFVRRLWVQYLLRDFGILTVFLFSGTMLFLFGSIFGAYHWWRSAQLNQATPTGTIMLAVLPVILGVQLLLQAVALDVQNAPAQPLQVMASLLPFTKARPR
jgi:dolichol-phosphate mannosyltransferase